MNAHPVADIFPVLGDAEYEMLRESIRKDGQKHACVDWTDENGECWLLDGRNRLRACEELGIAPRFETFVGSEQDAVDLAASLNVARRQSTPGQRAAAAVELVDVYKERFPQGRHHPANVPAEDNRDRAARVTGATPRYVSDLAWVKRERPDLFEAVKQGRKTANAAIQATRGGASKKRERDPLSEILEVIEYLTKEQRDIVRGALAQFEDPYFILGVSPTATTDDIKRAYRKRAANLHPDQNHTPNASIRFQELTAARDVLLRRTGKAES